MLRVIPTGILVGSAWALAWRTNGSIDAPDWLPYALLCLVVLAVSLAAGIALRPSGLPLAVAALLVGFGLWTALSIAWTPLPSLARDDALLSLFYAGAFVTPLLTLRSQADRQLAVCVSVLALSLLAVGTAVQVRFAAHSLDVFLDKRLNFPVSYWNAAATVFLVGVWPALALASNRRLHALLRVASLAGATCMLACWVMTQSKGGGLALAISGIVFFAVCRDRLRALVPTLMAAGLAALGARALTAPYRATDAALAPAIHHAGTVALELTAAAAVLGAAYALADERIHLSRRTRRQAGTAVATLLALGVLGGAAGFFTQVGHPGHFAAEGWDSFSHFSAHDNASSHFTSFGSDRYDFYRVALDEFKRHPLAGIGGRGWAAAYLRDGRGHETPERSHSIELDALGETGMIGFLLLAGAGALGLAAVARRAGSSLLFASLLATGVYLAVHTAVDWVWTIPSVGLFALTLVGIGASRSTWRPLRPGVGMVAGAVVAVVSVIAFAPPWLAARFTDHAYGQDAASASATLRWARRLDPLSAGPLLAEAALARSPADIPPLRKAVALQPGDSEVHYLLGLAYLNAARKAAARGELKRALELSPRDPAIRAALSRAR